MILALPLVTAFTGSLALFGAPLEHIYRRHGLPLAIAAAVPLGALWLVSVAAIAWFAVAGFIALSGAVLVAFVVEAARWSWRWLW